MKDTLGRDMEVGDRVAYAIRKSCTPELVLATVLEVADDYARVQRDKPRFPWKKEMPVPRRIRFPERVIIVERKGKA